MEHKGAATTLKPLCKVVRASSYNRVGTFDLSYTLYHDSRYMNMMAGDINLELSRMKLVVKRRLDLVESRRSLRLRGMDRIPRFPTIFQPVFDE